jgi:hypothetical protein
VPQEDVASRIQGVVEVIDYGLSRKIVKVDQDVAAEDEIKIPHGAQRHPVIQVQMPGLDQGGGPRPHQILVGNLNQVLLLVFFGNILERPP